MRFYLGIDLGAEHVQAHYLAEGKLRHGLVPFGHGRPWMPNRLTMDGNGEMRVGWAATALAAQAPQARLCARYLEDPRSCQAVGLTPGAVLERVLAQVLDTTRKHLTGYVMRGDGTPELGRVVIAVPTACVQDDIRGIIAKALNRTVSSLGIDVLFHILAAPVVAAAAALQRSGSKRIPQSNCLVVDIGVAALEVALCALDGTPPLRLLARASRPFAGDACDARIVAALGKQGKVQGVEALTGRLIYAGGRRERITLCRRAGIDDCEGLLRELAAELAAEVVDASAEVLAQQSGDIDHVIFCGAMSRFGHGFRKAVAETLHEGHAKRFAACRNYGPAADPYALDAAVAFGASLLAADPSLILMPIGWDVTMALHSAEGERAFRVIPAEVVPDGEVRTFSLLDSVRAAGLTRAELRPEQMEREGKAFSIVLAGREGINQEVALTLNGDYELRPAIGARPFAFDLRFVVRERDDIEVELVNLDLRQTVARGRLKIPEAEMA